MDRNFTASAILQWSTVALRKESVDRNLNLACNGILRLVSLSARRAWIEIFQWAHIRSAPRSLSARRAWIEITLPPFVREYLSVALRKESVDRNRCSYLHSNMSLDVALRKESVDRNSKMLVKTILRASLSARRAWIEMTLQCPAPMNLCGRSPQGERG